LIRAKKIAGLRRLERFNASAIYLPITTEVMRRSADLWAKARNKGVPTADAAALDADVIIAAQTLAFPFPLEEIVVATGNVKHLSRFVSAKLWTDISL